MLRDDAIKAIKHELLMAAQEFPPFSSNHEGYVIILEEMNKLQAEIRKQLGPIQFKGVEKEATQVAAMALRFLIDLC